MTRRRRLLVVAALVVVVVGVAVRPMLSDRPPGHEHRSTPGTSVVAVADPTATITAAAAAVRTLACRTATSNRAPTQRSAPRPRWCGRYTVTRSQALCRSADACTVQMIGTLTTPAANTAVALTVTLRRVTGRWQVTGIRS